MRHALSCTLTVLLTALSLFGCDSGLPLASTQLGGTYVGGIDDPEEYVVGVVLTIPAINDGTVFTWSATIECVTTAPSCTTTPNTSRTFRGSGTYIHPDIQFTSLDQNNPFFLDGNGTVSSDFQTITIPGDDSDLSDAVVVTRQ